MQHADGYTFALADDVVRTPVRYRNRFGIEIAGDLYRPADLDEDATRAAVVIGPPHGGVKEQGPGVYADQLAQRGFVALAFDPSYNGESGGSPRHLTSPEVFAEDFSAGIDFLGTLASVDRDRLGVVGICGSGGFALSQAAVDPRIRAVVASAMYDISGVSREGFQHGASPEDRAALLRGVADQRWADVDSGTPARQGDFPDEIPADGGPDPITSEFWEYYVTDRGRAERSVGGFTTTSWAAHVNAGPLRHLADIAPRPVLFVTGTDAHSRYFTDDAFAAAAEPKRIEVVDGARHIDLYDRVDLIPFDAIEAFLAERLTAP